MTEETQIKLPTGDAYVARKKKDRRKSSFAVEGGALNMNSMMDMMTIILTFLMKSIGAEPIQTNPSPDLRIPMSSSDLPPEDMLVLYVSKKWVLVGDKPVTPINEGKIDPSLLQNATSAIVPELQQTIEDSLNAQEQWARIAGRDFERVVTIVSDGDTPYRLLTQVMITSAAAGIQNFKFAIISTERKLGT